MKIYQSTCLQKIQYAGMLFREMNNDLADLEVLLGIKFKDLQLLRQAVIHSSFINENPGYSPFANERLEFLGDAVLGLVIAQKLFHDYPQYDEGQLTRFRAALVNESTLARLARNFHLGDFLFLGKGEEATGGRNKPANLSAAFEAVIAAIYLDQGLEQVARFIYRVFSEEVQGAIEKIVYTDYKSVLQEIVQRNHQYAPVYYLVGVEGPDHERTFTVEVRVGGKVMGKGSGKSKKAAEMEAAREALENIESSLQKK